MLTGGFLEEDANYLSYRKSEGISPAPIHFEPSYSVVPKGTLFHAANPDPAFHAGLLSLRPADARSEWSPTNRFASYPSLDMRLDSEWGTQEFWKGDFGIKAEGLGCGWN